MTYPHVTRDGNCVRPTSDTPEKHASDREKQAEPAISDQRIRKSVPCVELIASQRTAVPMGRIRCLDAIRGFASVGVLVFHTLNALTTEAISPAVAFFQNAAFSVISLGLPGMRIPLFFMISGFSNHLKFARTVAKGMMPAVNVRDFLVRRFRRLYPDYVVALSFSCLLVLMGMVNQLPLMSVERYPGDRFVFLGLDYLTHLLFLHGFFPYFDRSAGNGPLWTMSREVQFYLLYFPLLAIRERLSTWACLGFALTVSFMSIGTARHFADDHLNLAYAIGNSGLAFWPFWVFGLVAAEMTYRLMKSPGRFESLAAFLAAAWIYSGDRLGTSSSPFLHMLLLAFTLFALVTFLVETEAAGYWPHNLPVRWLENAGAYSYHIFLIHFPIVMVLSRAMRHWNTDGSVATLVLAATIIAVTSLAAAVALKKMMDQAITGRRPSGDAPS